ncbi:hypothetical protein [Pseudoleptotrichia goodfellowii]|uniref:DUF304 domain-containing protein n=1 Tax=Pseudoleptotrichia goodfellowii TaxID=157692 RepID=A0A510JBF5_9FUSO|nr:hypothetical protein [Pseudoleptotrichia goodfellowii]BBM36659.1 hypothetical protein JCM16774_1603 [Pseudoleptotrichia goodfellowii]
MDIYKLENLKKRLEEYKIEDEKDTYVFRVNKKYATSSSIFFIMISFIAIYSLYKELAGIEKFSVFRMIMSIALIGYSIFAAWLLFGYKIVIKKNVIIAGKVSIDMQEIESATVKIDRISAFKYDRFLDIVTKDKKRVKLRLNIGNDMLFLKLIQNYIGDKLEIAY